MRRSVLGASLLVYLLPIGAAAQILPLAHYTTSDGLAHNVIATHRSGQSAVTFERVMASDGRGAETASGAVHVFLWRSGVMIDLGALP